ncbi:hypothetical protein CGZ93_04825 [Enemella dayhoffiae]|uniref:Type II secretion system protein GspF domain-containing protein n=1 Tax=Enemella dayhoffiae TaxID=2016507 RepID=A0A255HCT7_9ACTN|nr:type II secretion system F family protein [Enemella dayhoffiae]OYO24144.1 hypothetical protein CGZ93_04825 [Enemella dayhoffiae]
MSTLAIWLAAMAAALLIGPQPSRRLRASRSPARGPTWLRPRPGAPTARTRWSLGIGAAVAVGVLLPGWWGLLVGPLVMTGVAVLLGRLEPPTVARARERRINELPQLLDLVAGCLAAGLPLRGAIGVVAETQQGPLAEDLAAVLASLEVGRSESEAWTQLEAVPGWRLVARDIARAAGAGTELVQVLQRHADRARRDRAALAHQRARTLGVRGVFPMAVCFLPAFVLIGMVPIVGSIVFRVLG